MMTAFATVHPEEDYDIYATLDEDNRIVRVCDFDKNEIEMSRGALQILQKEADDLQGN